MNCPKCHSEKVVVTPIPGMVRCECGTYFRASEVVSLPGLSSASPVVRSDPPKPPKISGRKISVPVLILCGLLVLAGLWALSEVREYMRIVDDPRADETPQQRLARWRDVADFEMLKSCTNDLVGLNRVINEYVDASSDNIQQWSGSVEAEYVNHVGGIDRTNLPYVFKEMGGDLYGVLDEEKLARLQIEEFKRQMKAIETGGN